MGMNTDHPALKDVRVRGDPARSMSDLIYRRRMPASHLLWRGAAGHSRSSAGIEVFLSLTKPAYPKDAVLRPVA
jgi:hypothetical protein